MVRYPSIFSQMLSLVNRVEFHRIVNKNDGEKHSKGYSCWEQFVAMLFCQLAQAKSIREICGGLACCVGKIKHLGVNAAPKKSTLSYANAHRPWEIYEDLFYLLLEKCRSIAPKKKFRFKNKLLSMDSSTISLCLSMFEWARFRQTKGAVKLHTLLDHDGYLPVYVYISNGSKHDVTVARHVPLAPGSIVAMDKGYNDYKLFAYFTEHKIFFVTRLKDNAVYEVIKTNPVPKNRNIVSDDLIKFTGIGAQEKCPHIFRRIVVWDKEENR